MTQAVTAYDRTMVDYYAKRHMDNSWIKNNMTLVARRFDTAQLDEYPKTKGFRLS